jgi:hypothetical protein
MAATLTPVYSSYFNYKLATPQITFTDSSDYVGDGFPGGGAEFTVVAKVEGPSGVFYENTNHSLPDINPGTSLDSLIEIPLPTDINGDVELGAYTITLSYKKTSNAATYVGVENHTLAYVSPVVDISMAVDCLSPSLSATDNTDYVSSLITPTITRAFAIQYPSPLVVADVTSTTDTVSTNTFYTKKDDALNYTSTLTTDLTYAIDPANLIYIIDEVTGGSNIDVLCPAGVCAVFCCLNTQYKRWQSAKCGNSSNATVELNKFIQMTSISELLGNAVICGNTDDINDYVTQILAIGNCNSGCCDDENGPFLVTGLGIAGNAIIVAAGTGVNVVANVVGNDTTYTVSLTTLNQQILAGAYNTVPIAGANITVTPGTPSTTAGVTTLEYTIVATDTIVQSLFARSKLTFSTTAVPVPSIETQNKYGAVFSALVQTGGSEFVLNTNNGSYADWSTNLNLFTCDNFFTTPGDYFPEVDIVNIVSSGGVGDEASWIKDVDVEITSMGASSFNFRFVDKSGSPINGLALDSTYSSLELIFKIQS